MRKFLEGTYAARVRFHDNAADGNDGDAVISTFFTINDTLAYTEAGYSECDFEYLPNGGWDAGSASALYFTYTTYYLADCFCRKPLVLKPR